MESLKEMTKTTVGKKVNCCKLVTIVNGDYVPIVGFGNIQLQPSLSLHNVLHAPKMANNLISIHKLIQDLNYVITFLSFRTLSRGAQFDLLKRKR
ncbi:hypothetical protein CR513_26842, partial [Mucuna pruriens]